MCPAGIAPAGYGTPPAAPIAQTVPYPDPLTGLAQSGYQIGTGDYTFTADGRIVGAPTVKTLVEHAILTAYNSSAVVGFGLNAPNGVKAGNYAQQVSACLTNALAALVTQGLIQIVKVTVTNMSNPDGTVGMLAWKDLTAPASASPSGGSSSSQYTTSF
jgi:hypothetical protein